MVSDWWANRTTLKAGTSFADLSKVGFLNIGDSSLGLPLRVQVPNNHILTQYLYYITITEIPSTYLLGTWTLWVSKALEVHPGYFFSCLGLRASGQELKKDSKI